MMPSNGTSPIQRHCSFLTSVLSIPFLKMLIPFPFLETHNLSRRILLKISCPHQSLLWYPKTLTLCSLGILGSSFTLRIVTFSVYILHCLHLNSGNPVKIAKTFGHMDLCRFPAVTLSNYRNLAKSFNFFIPLLPSLKLR